MKKKSVLKGRGVFRAPRSQLFLIMQLTFIFTFCCLFEVYAQFPKVNIDVKNTEIKVVFDELTRQTGLKFFFNHQEIDVSKKVTIRGNQTDMGELLSKMLGVGYEFEEFDGMIIIKPTSIHQQQQRALQQSQIVGTVLDDNGKPLAGAAVVLKGTKVGVITNTKGEFTISVPSSIANPVIVVSFIGMKTREVEVKDQTPLKITMIEEQSAIDEVVVTGIFTRKASSYTGSVVTITSKDIARVGNQNVFQSLKNLDPSLFVMDNIDLGSNPNALPEMQMRGISSFPLEETGVRLKGNYQNSPNQPLFILDGFEASVERVMDMDMNRVESITLLKDASAKAIYGSKAANGVVVIETKRVVGSEQRITYTGSLDIEMPDLSSYNLANALEKLEIERLDGMYDTGTFYDAVIANHKRYESRKQLVLAGLDTYWLSKPLRTGVGHKHNLSIELGDSRSLRAVLGLTYNQVMGVMKGSERRNVSGTIDLSYHHGDFRFKSTTTITDNRSFDSPYGQFSEYTKMNPYWRAKDPETGSVARWAENLRPNPLYDAEIGTLLKDSYLDFLQNFQVEWSIRPELILRFRAGVSIKRSDGDEFLPAKHSKFYKINQYSLIEDQLRKGSYRLDNGKSNTISGDLNMSYSKDINKHALFANGGITLQESEYSAYVHVAEGFPNSQVADITFARQYALDSRPVGNSSISRNIDFLAIGGYSYDNRYLLDLNVRTGASSLYGSDNRWRTGWSTGIGWNLHNEHFFPLANIVKQLKLRASVGVTGNLNFQTNEAVATYNYYTNDTYLGMTGSYLGRLANPALKWEEKKDYNLGFDAIIHRATIRFDLYKADTKNMLTDVSVPTSTGFATVKDNLGLVRNSGLETNISYSVFQNQKGFLNIFGSLVTTKNKIIRLSESMKAFNELRDNLAMDKANNRPVLKYVDGESMQTIWAVPSAGIDPQTGQEVYIKKNGELTYTYNASDLAPVGNSLPKYRGNFGFSAEYKGFGLSSTFRFLTGCEMYNKTLVDRVENVDIEYNVDKRVLYGRWKNPGDVVSYKRLGATFQYPGDSLAHLEMTRATSRFVQDRRELTWGALNAYYEFDMERIKHLGLKRLKLSFYMNEILTISSIEIERGYSYPFARTMSFSLVATF